MLSFFVTKGCFRRLAYKSNSLVQFGGYLHFIFKYGKKTKPTKTTFILTLPLTLTLAIHVVTDYLWTLVNNVEISDNCKGQIMTTMVTWPHQKCSVWFQMMKDAVLEAQHIYIQGTKVSTKEAYKKRYDRSSKKASSREACTKRASSKEAALPIQTFP